MQEFGYISPDEATKPHDDEASIKLRAAGDLLRRYMVEEKVLLERDASDDAYTQLRMDELQAKIANATMVISRIAGLDQIVPVEPKFRGDHWNKVR